MGLSSHRAYAVGAALVSWSVALGLVALLFQLEARVRAHLEAGSPAIDRSGGLAERGAREALGKPWVSTAAAGEPVEVRLSLGGDADIASLRVRDADEDVSHRFRFGRGGWAGRLDPPGRGARALEVSVRDGAGALHTEIMEIPAVMGRDSVDLGQAHSIVGRLLAERNASRGSSGAAEELAFMLSEAQVSVARLAETLAGDRAAVHERASLVALSGRVADARRALGDHYAGHVSARRARVLEAAAQLAELISQAAAAEREMLPGIRDTLAALEARPKPSPAAPVMSPAVPLMWREGAMNEGGSREHPHGHASEGRDPAEWLEGPRAAVSPGRSLGVGVAHAASLDPALAPAVGVRFEPADPEDPIVRRAAALGHDPISIYEFVRNEIAFEVSGGLARGARATLLAGRGGNADQVALLVALLRASGYRARFVVGDVAVEESLARSWVHASHFNGVQRLLALSSPAPERLLASDGQPATVLLREHWWARVEVPYGAEQGRDLAAPRRWLFLDPSFVSHEVRQGVPECGGTRVDFGLDGPGGFLAGLEPRSLIESHADRKRECLRALSPPRGLEALSQRGPLEREAPGALPPSLPYRAVRVHWEFADAGALAPMPQSAASQPVDLRDLLVPRVLVEVRVAGAVALRWEAAHADVSDGRIHLAWHAADAAAQLQIDEACGGDLARCDPTLGIRVSLALSVDGQTVADTGGLELLHGDPGPEVWVASTHVLSQRVAAPDSLDAASYYRPTLLGWVVGDSAVLSMDVGQGSAALTDRVLRRMVVLGEEAGLAEWADGGQGGGATPPPEARQALIEALLHLGAVYYAESVRDALAQMSELEPVAFQVAGLGTTTARSEVVYFGGAPVSVVPADLVIDMVYAGRGVPLGVAAEAPLQDDLMRFLVLTGSELEHRVWEDLTQVESISTVKGLQLAASVFQAGVARFRIGPGVPVPSGTAPAVAALRARFPNHTLVGHTGELQFNDWRGTVLYAERIAGGYSFGAFIDGGDLQNGGATTGQGRFDVGEAAEPTRVIGPDGGAVRVADPVNVVSGNLDHSETDWVLPTVGSLSFALTRTYNSQLEAEGPFGHGWTHSFHVYIEAIDDDADGQRELGGSGGAIDDVDGEVGAVAVVDGTGSRRRFRIVPGGTRDGPFFAEAGERGFLAVEGEALVYRTLAGEAFHFPRFSPEFAVGERVFLASLRDPLGLAIDLHYDAAPRQLRVVDALGRTLRLVYDAQERFVVRAEDDTGRAWTYGYAGSDLSWVADPVDAAAGRVSSRYFYASGTQDPHNLRRVENALGEGTTFEYYANDKVYRIVDPTGAETRLVYDLFRFQTTEIDPLGRRTRYRFDPNGRVVRVRYDDGSVEDRVYDPTRGALIERIDALGRRWRFEHDVFGLVVRAVSPDGTEEHFEYAYQDDPGLLGGRPGHARVVRYTDARGTLFEYAYDVSGQRTRESVWMDAGAGLERVDLRRYAWTPWGQLSLQVENRDPTTPLLGPEGGENDRITRYFYAQDAPHRRTRIEDGLGGATHFEWDVDLGEPDRGVLRRVLRSRIATLPDGQVWRSDEIREREVDAVGRLISLRRPSGARQERVYDPAGRLVESRVRARDDRGMEGLRSTRFGRDAAGRIVRVVDPLLGEEHREYDAVGNLVKRVDRSGRATRLRYDTRNRLIARIAPSGREIRYGRDALGRVLERHDSEGGVVRFEYDASGRMLSREDADGVREEWEYDAGGERIGLRRGRLLAGQVAPNRDGLSTTWDRDALGRVVVVRDALDAEWRFEWDLLGNVAEIVDPHGGVTHRVHDRQGRTIEEVDALGGWMRYTRDSLGDVVAVEQPSGRRRTLRADPEGREVVVRYEASDGVREDRFAFDGFGAPTRELGPTGAVGIRSDALGRPISRSGGPGGSRYARYDGEGRLLSETGTGGAVTRYDYDADGRLALTTLPGGATIERQYDGVGRMTAELHSGGAARFLRYTPGGRISQIVHSAAGVGVTSAFAYGFDAEGNATVEQRRGSGSGGDEVTLFEYSARRELIEATYPDGRVQRFAYDDVGNRIYEADDGRERWLRHDAALRLRSVDDQPVGGTTLEVFTHDADGRRTGWTELETGRSETYEYDRAGRLARHRDREGRSWRWLYDARGQRSREISAEGALDYVWSRGNRVEVLSEGVLQSRATFGQGLDDLQALTQAGVMATVLRDRLGSVVAVGDGAGVPISTRAYDAFGATRSETGAHPTDFDFMGRTRGPGGLADFRARVYDPATGRFLTPDPLGLAGGLHRYAFVGNDPVNRIDPLGLKPGEVQGGHGPLNTVPPGHVDPFELDVSAGVGVGLGVKLQVPIVGRLEFELLIADRTSPLSLTETLEARATVGGQLLSFSSDLGFEISESRDLREVRDIHTPFFTRLLGLDFDFVDPRVSSSANAEVNSSLGGRVKLFAGAGASLDFAIDFRADP